MGTEVVTARMRSAAEWLAGRGRRARQQAASCHGADRLPARSGGQPSRLRSFDPARIADLEYRAWTGYYRRNWPQVLAALAGLVGAGFGMDWYWTLHGAWLLLRASQLWGTGPRQRPRRGTGLHAAVLCHGQAQLRRACQPGTSRRA